MHKIINGLRYGNAKTKSYIIIILCLLIFGTISLGMVITSKAPLWGMSAAFCYILAVILMQSVSFKNSGKIAPKGKNKPNKKSADAKKADSNLGEKELTQEEKDKIAEQEKEEAIHYLEKFSEKDVRGICVKYKVNKDHRPIMIDSCVSKEIYQCPAYAWMEKGELKLLLFEKEPRKITLSKEEIGSIAYERNADVNILTDYQAFSSASFLKLVFSSYLPTTFEERLGQRNYKKNLYVIGEDLKVTNTSAKTMLNLLSLNLSVSHLIRDERFHNPYFESAYALNIMLKDTVLSVSEYKSKIKDLLQKLTDAKISNEDFMVYMSQLVQGRLITREYAEYYIERRK